MNWLHDLAFVVQVVEMQRQRREERGLRDFFFTDAAFLAWLPLTVSMCVLHAYTGKHAGVGFRQGAFD